MLRFGDGTPFPHAENVLAILEDAAGACADMFAAAVDLDRQREDAAAARRMIDDEVHQLGMLEHVVARVGETATGPTGPIAQRTARRAVAATQRLVAEARKELDQLAAVKAADPPWEPLAQRIHVAAARFFEHHSLPGTRWAWQWDVTTPTTPRAVATGHAAPFQITFELEVTPVWRAPVRIAVLAGGLVLQLPARRVFGASSASAHKLDNLFLVHAAVDAEGRSLLVRERATPSAGWRIRIPSQGGARCHAVDKDGKIDGPEFELSRDEHLNKLWTAIETEVATMHAKRRVREILLRNVAIAAIAEITNTPRAILDVLAPIIRAIRAHSTMPDELVLKRDVADGVRAELYVSREAILARYADLPAAYRRFLDEAGFGSSNPQPVVVTPPKPVAVPVQSGPRFARASQTRMPSALPIARPSLARPDSAS